jgi:ribosome recycling factor
MAVSIMAGIPALKELNSDLKRRMDGAVATFQANLASTRTGRASVHMLDQVKVDYYGTHTPISQLAQVSAPEAQMILICALGPHHPQGIEKAMRIADLGFNPISDGKVLRVPVPPMTEERRRDVCKHLNKVLEEHRTAVRNVRRDGNDALKKLAKDKKISEDEEKRSPRRSPEDDRRRDPPHGRALPQKRSRSDAGVIFPHEYHSVVSHGEKSPPKNGGIFRIFRWQEAFLSRSL